MSYFMQTGDKFVPMPHKNSLLEALPLGSYSLEVSMSGPYFAQISDAEKVEKVYGDAGRRAERILNTFDSRESSTGTLLSGEKGAGKSLLARLIAEQARETRGMPTIYIKSGPSPEMIESMLNSLDHPATVVFDEFEKNFERKEQEGLLTLLDGTAATKHLFVFTVNQRSGINEYMINRPGRIFYNLTFDALTEDFITEYANDLLKNKEWVTELVDVSKRVHKINFDMLKSIVEESNRYNESPFETVKWLNINTTEQIYTYELAFVDAEGKTFGTGTTRGRLYGDMGYPKMMMDEKRNYAEMGEFFKATVERVKHRERILEKKDDHILHEITWAKAPMMVDFDIDDLNVVEYDASTGEGVLDVGDGVLLVATPQFHSYVPRTDFF